MATNIIPTMKYQNATDAITWLGRAFGFEEYLVVPGDDGSIAHAQLVFEGGMIMLSSVGISEFDTLQTTPANAGDVATQSAYIIVTEIDAHYERAVAAGAEIVMDIKDEDYDGRGYSCLDPEGHLWNFGTLNPWQA